MSDKKFYPQRNVLINGDLVVHGFPKPRASMLGTFLVYRILNDCAQFWHIFPNQVKAVQTASSMCGHIIQIKSIENKEVSYGVDEQ